jgi:hypothetical protein
MLRKCDRNPESCRVFEGATHEAIILHTATVVGEHPHSERRHFRHGGKGCSTAINRDCTGDPNIAQTSSDSGIENLLHDCGTVDGRLGIGHGDDRGVPTESRSAAASLDRFGFLATRFAQMGVDVDQSGADDASGGIEFECTLESEGFSIQFRIDAHNDPVGRNGDIGHPLAIAIDDSTATDDDS